MIFPGILTIWFVPFLKKAGFFRMCCLQEGFIIFFAFRFLTVMNLLVNSLLSLLSKIGQQ